MATLTKSTGTVTLSGAAEKVTLPASYGWVWVKNMSEGDIFAGLSADISEGSDGVLTIPAGECGRVQMDGFSSIYLLGTGNALVAAQNYADCPFKVGGKGGEIPDLSAYAKTADVPNIKVNEAVNADTLGGKSAYDFAQIINLGGSQTDTKTAVGSWGKTTIYNCSNWTDFPAESLNGQGILIAANYVGSGIAGTDQMWVVQFFISAATGVVYKRNINGTSVGNWCGIYSADNKPYITGSFSGTAASFDFDYAPSFAIANDEGNIKFGTIVVISVGGSERGYGVNFSGLSDTTHQYIIFK